MESAFILAAGKGERLRPLTDNTPKPLIKVRGRPILSRILDQVEPLKLKRVVLNSWYHADQIEDFVREEQERRSFQILLSKESELLGTGGGLKKALPFIGQAPFLMLNGDSLWRGDLKGFVQSALAESPEVEAVWGGTSVRKDQSSVGLNSDRKLIRIGKLWQMEAETEVSQFCFSGIQLVRRLQEADLPDQGCIIRAYWLARLQEAKCISMKSDFLQDWEDLGTVERLEQAENWQWLT